MLELSDSDYVSDYDSDFVSGFSTMNHIGTHILNYNFRVGQLVKINGPKTSFDVWTSSVDMDGATIMDPPFNALVSTGVAQAVAKLVRILYMANENNKKPADQRQKQAVSLELELPTGLDEFAARTTCDKLSGLLLSPTVTMTEEGRRAYNYEPAKNLNLLEVLQQTYTSTNLIVLVSLVLDGWRTLGSACIGFDAPPPFHPFGTEMTTEGMVAIKTWVEQTAALPSRPL
eukprot:SAG11_NODE_321_length_10781_cov_6.440835_7_plen_230_part_00